MTLSDWITIVAIFAGPFFAVLATEWIRRSHESRQRKIRVFRTLMSTRASRLSPTHVEALNLIDIEFDSKNPRERHVIEAWKLYHSHLGDVGYPKETWAARCAELLVDLLHAMSQCLNYPFDKSHIKNSSYYPDGYGELEEDQHAARKALVEVLEGRKPLSVISWMAPEQLAQIMGGAKQNGSEQDATEEPAKRLELSEDS